MDLHKPKHRKNRKYDPKAENLAAWAVPLALWTPCWNSVSLDLGLHDPLVDFENLPDYMELHKEVKRLVVSFSSEWKKFVQCESHFMNLIIFYSSFSKLLFLKFKQSEKNNFMKIKWEIKKALEQNPLHINWEIFTTFFCLSTKSPT